MTKLLEQGMSASDFLGVVSANPAYAANKQVGAHPPAGYFYSPVVDPSLVGPYHAMPQATTPDGLRQSGIAIGSADLTDRWKRNRDFIAASPRRDEVNSGLRYLPNDGRYPVGDANTLRLMMREFRPKRVIKIGSGFSLAAMLDAAGELGLDEFRLTCIDPCTGHVSERLRDEDGDRVKVVEPPVQKVDAAMFEELGRNDFCFIDSIHALKTGSDVHYELFHILPRLKPGVLVHIHDCRYPFEHTPIQVFEKNFSWNDIHGVRAMLMHGAKFRVLSWGNMFERDQPASVRETVQSCSTNPGSALWLETIA